MRDSTKQQIFDACGRFKAAAEVMGFMVNVLNKQKRSLPDEPAGSSKLWLDFTYASLRQATGYSRAQLIRAITRLEQLDFLVVHRSPGEKNYYEVKPHRCAEYVQPMPLFEQDHGFNDGETGLISGDDTRLIMRPVPVSSCNRYPSHHETGSPYMSLRSLSSPSGELADAAIQTEAEERQAVVEVLPAAELPVLDAERESLIEQCRVIGIAQEHTEAILTDHSRQKLQAALECLHAKARYGVVKNQGGFVIGFLKFPVKYGYELDSQGCWRPSREIAQAEKLRRAAIKARDRPAEDAEVSRLHAARRAWDECDEPTKQQIQTLIDQQNPTLYAAAKTALCWREALERTHIRES